MPITGEQYYTTATPGFIWKGTTKIFTAYDKYIADKGSLNVYLFGVIPISRGSGPTYDQGELIRWLGESVWFPTNLLAGENMQWSPVDDTTAILKFIHLQHTISFTVSFNERHEIALFKTMRNMGNEGEELWVGKCGNYTSHEGIVIPDTIEGSWYLSGGEFTYAQFHLISIQFGY